MKKEQIAELQNILRKINRRADSFVHFEGNIPKIQLDIFLKDIQALYEVADNAGTENSVYQTPPAIKSNGVHAAPVVVPHLQPEPVQVIAEKQPEEIKAEVTIEEPQTQHAPVIDEIEEPEEEMDGLDNEKAPYDEEYLGDEPDDHHSEDDEEDSFPETELNEEKPEAVIAPRAEIPKAELPVQVKIEEKVIAPTEETPVMKVPEIKIPAPKASPQKEVRTETSINDKLASSKGDKSLNSRMTRKPIADIKAAIGINERFAFVKELFRGNNEEFKSAIDKLNNSGNADTALDYISELKTRFDWDEENPEFLKLSDIVERRYL